MTEQGCLYKITNTVNNKKYFGQCKLLKTKDGKQYNYGIGGRWSDHVSDSRFKESPLHAAIREIGHEYFQIEELERTSLDELDAKESFYIKKYNSLIPNGYNVMKHGRVKTRLSSNIGERYIAETIKVEVVPIKTNNVYKIIYVYLHRIKKEAIRLVFGSGKDANLEEARKEVDRFLFLYKNAGIEILDFDIDETTDPMFKYNDKIEHFSNLNINKIVMTKTKDRRCLIKVSLIDNPGWKNDKNISFGGKTIEFEEAYSIAKSFIERINNKNVSIIDKTKMVSNR